MFKEQGVSLLVPSKGKDWIRRLALNLTRGQLINYAQLLYGVPTMYPNKGPGRQLKVFDDDIFIVSYPRSGNTWMRFLISNLRNQSNDISYENIEEVAADIYQTPETLLRKMARPRLLKSHESFDPHYGKVVYVVRNLVDVAISQYRTMRGIDKQYNYPFSEFVTRYVAGDFDRYFGTWDEHINSWIHHPNRGAKFLLVRYEDLKSDGPAILRKVAKFLFLNDDDVSISRALLRGSREEMTKLYESTGKSLERKIGKQNALYLKPTEQQNVEMRAEDIARLIEPYKETMKLLGYPLEYKTKK